MNLENDLKRALRRESPPPGFASRVLERIERSDGLQPVGAGLKTSVRWWRAAAASLVLASMLGGYAIHERRKGERARDQLLQAMSIASEKVRYAQQEVREIGSR